MKIALTVAGSDSGGGAGIQADLKTFHQFGVYGTSAIVALTAQNTRGVRAVHPAPVAFVRQQLEAIADDLPPDAVKTGMLAEPDLVHLVAAVIRERRWAPVVVDPVMAATSGDRLLSRAAEEVVRTELLPLATITTPNLDEAEILTGDVVRDAAAMERAGRCLVELGAGAALIKGGHLEGSTIVDLLVSRHGIRRFERPRIDTTSTHGTGCTLSAAIAAGLALGHALEEAVETAIDFVHRAMESAPALGGGHGPLNHQVAATILR